MEHLSAGKEIAMGIGNVTSTNRMPDLQMNIMHSKDSKSKNIQNEITGKQQQMKRLSSEEELSVNEKMNEEKKLKKEISSLNTELKQHQEELRRTQRREMMMSELKEEKEQAEEEKSEDRVQSAQNSAGKSEEKNLPADKTQSETANTNLKEDLVEKESKIVDNDSHKETMEGLSQKKMHAIVSADTSVQQAGRQGSVIARIRGGIAIFKGEINQDENRGIDTEKKQTELEKMEKKEERARAFQASVLGEANSTIKSAAKAEVNESKDQQQINTENNTYISALRISREEQQAAQQSFYLSLGN